MWESAAFFSGDDIPIPLGSMHRRNQPHGAFKTQDGYLCIAADQQHHWQVFCELTRTLKLPPLIAVPSMAVPAMLELVTVSGSTSVVPEIIVLNVSVVALTTSPLPMPCTATATVCWPLVAAWRPRCELLDARCLFLAARSPSSR